MGMKAVIFDLDGVVVSTDEYHYRAWKQMADDEGIPFDRMVNQRLRGVSRMESLNIVLEKAERPYSDPEKAALAERKNKYYRSLLGNLTPGDILPGVMEVLESLKSRGIKVAVGSSSKNTPYILEKIDLSTYFDAVADGNGITKSKPDPEVFLLAAKLLGSPPSDCAVVEDAYAGIEAAKAGGMKAVGVGYARRDPACDYACADLAHLSVDELLKGKKPGSDLDEKASC
jgi:beta-phosphoglucomutase